MSSARRTLWGAGVDAGLPGRGDRPEPPSVSDASRFWPLVAFTVVSTAATLAMIQRAGGAQGAGALATGSAGVLLALGVFGVSTIRRRERRLVRAYDRAQHSQITRTAHLLESARALTSESAETAIHRELPGHARRLVPHESFALALFEENHLHGRVTAEGVQDAERYPPSLLESEVAESRCMAERARREGAVTWYEVALPLCAGGTLVGVLSLARRGGAFSPRELEDAAALCAHAGIAVEKARALAQIVDGKREWEDLFHSTAEGLALIDAGGRVRRANAALVALSGDRPLAHGHHGLWPAMPEGASCPVCETLAHGTRVARTVRDPHGRTLEIATSPANAGGAVLVVRDVTSTCQAQENLRIARQRMFESEKLAAVGRLAAGVSHEVNNPLMGISGLAAVLLDDDALSGDVRESVELIQREARRAAKITRDLLQFVHAGDRPAECVDANELACEVGRLRLHAQQDRATTLELDLGDPPVLALGSAVPLMQVIVNLVTNAEDAVADSPVRRIRLSTERDGATVRLAVEDSGAGVPAEVRTRLFEPFFTTKAPGKGTGLGLSLCYSIVERLGGTIRVEEGALGGARFVVELPAYEAEAVALAS